MSAVVAGGRENKTRSEYLFVIADIGAKSPLGFPRGSFLQHIEILSDRTDKGKAAQRDRCRSLCVMCGCGERQREAGLSGQGSCHEAIWERRQR